MRTAIRGFEVDDGMRIEPRAVAAVGQRIGAGADVLRHAASESAAARFGPGSVDPALREHGVAYAAGMDRVVALIEAMRETAHHLTVGFDSAAVTLVARDAAVAERIADAGRTP